MAVYALCVESKIGIISVCPYASIVLPRVYSKLIGEEVSKPDALCFGVLPRLRRSTAEAVKDDHSNLPFLSKMTKKGL
jgi:hypothetical protein